MSIPPPGSQNPSPILGFDNSAAADQIYTPPSNTFAAPPPLRRGIRTFGLTPPTTDNDHTPPSITFAEPPPLRRRVSAFELTPPTTGATGTSVWDEIKETPLLVRRQATASNTNTNTNAGANANTNANAGANANANTNANAGANATNTLNPMPFVIPHLIDIRDFMTCVFTFNSVFNQRHYLFTQFIKNNPRLLRPEELFYYNRVYAYVQGKGEADPRPLHLFLNVLPATYSLLPAERTRAFGTSESIRLNLFDHLTHPTTFAGKIHEPTIQEPAHEPSTFYDHLNRFFPEITGINCFHPLSCISDQSLRSLAETHTTNLKSAAFRKLESPNSTSALNHLFSKCPNIEELCLSMDIPIDSETLASLGSNLQNLKKLTLGLKRTLPNSPLEHLNISEHSMNLFFQRAKRLKGLRFHPGMICHVPNQESTYTPISNTTLFNIGDHLSHLEKLSIPMCIAHKSDSSYVPINDDGIKALCEGCQDLEELELIMPEGGYHYDALTGQSLNHIATLSKLRKLKLNGWFRGINATNLASFLEAKQGSPFSDISFYGNLSITRQAMRTLRNRFPDFFSSTNSKVFCFF